MNIKDFFFLALATWRVVNLICNETGPFAVFEKIRAWSKQLESKHTVLKEFHLHELNSCEWCLSVYIGTFTIVMYILFPRWTMVVAYALSLSATTIFIKHIIQPIGAWMKYIENANKIQVNKEARDRNKS